MDLLGVDSTLERLLFGVTKEGSLMIDLILELALLLGSGTVSQGPSEPMGPVPAPLPPVGGAR